MNATSNYKSAEGEREVMALYDAVLARWPVPYQALNVDTRHGHTFVIASGEASAPPLVLLHGSCSNAVSWAGEVAAYSSACRVYAVDLPGEPGRSTPDRPSWQDDAFAEWLEDLLDRLGVARAALLGLSQGGWTALRFATRCPERVAQLVLLAPGGVAPARASFILRAVVLSMLGQRGAEALNRIVFNGQPLHPEAARFMDVIMTHFRARIGAQPLFTDDELRRLTMPILLIAGARDAILPSEKIVARLSSLLPHLEAHLLPEAGHALIDQAPAVMAFLAA